MRRPALLRPQNLPCACDGVLPKSCMSLGAMPCKASSLGTCTSSGVRPHHNRTQRHCRTSIAHPSRAPLLDSESAAAAGASCNTLTSPSTNSRFNARSPRCSSTAPATALTAFSSTDEGGGSRLGPSFSSSVPRSQISHRRRSLSLPPCCCCLSSAEELIFSAYPSASSLVALALDSPSSLTSASYMRNRNRSTAVSSSTPRHIGGALVLASSTSVSIVSSPPSSSTRCRLR